ncbi:MAG: AAA family ATPase [Candidatus Aenigmarchaeota archaeon]|nr:AAA family ATPase [Candidatus Aenigmarchaeota archaeon]
MGMKIICLAGMPGAGKGEASRVIAGHGVPVFTMSSVVRDEVRRRGLEVNNTALEIVGIDLRKKFGRDVVAKKTAEAIKKMNSEIVCVDGVRNEEEIETLRTVGDVSVILIDAPKSARFVRLKKRGEDRDPKNIGDFELKEKRQDEIGIEKVFDMADYRVINDGTLEEFRLKVSKVLANVGHV